ncbi:MAG: response regulator, partial [Deltaproteobacteria bacterium]|nr:response regulator [Deltaproteobacteria bacterium]
MKVTGKIFIADNDPDNRELLRGQLESLKCDFISARDGLDEWEHIQKDTPDLILINISLPDMDGYELCRRIKKSGSSDESVGKLSEI